ncbi:MAG: ABC transporter ATP-binding protein [Actinobacteria bacterium]|nr:ABC transporter ATP-binding protein [Actinomycetota bacterium]
MEFEQGQMSQRAVAVVRELRKTVAVGFRRRKVEILRGASFAVNEGDVFGMLGPNGAGKTTALKIILGLMRPDTGVIDLGVARAAVGYLPENPYFYDYLSGRELLQFCGRLFGLPESVRRERVARLLAQVGLEEAADRQLRRYSKGMLQRIGIAQALINDPHLVFLDEPMTGLDPLGRAEVKRIIQGLREQGRTVLFNSHILADVEELCTRVAIMRAGTVIWEGAVAEAKPSGGGNLEDFFIAAVSA